MFNFFLFQVPKQQAYIYRVFWTLWFHGSKFHIGASIVNQYIIIYKDPTASFEKEKV